MCAVRREDNGRVDQAEASLLRPARLIYGTQGDMSLPASVVCRAEIHGQRYYLLPPPPDDPIPPDEPMLPEPDPEPELLPPLDPFPGVLVVPGLL